FIGSLIRYLRLVLPSIKEPVRSVGRGFYRAAGGNSSPFETLCVETSDNRPEPFFSQDCWRPHPVLRRGARTMSMRPAKGKRWGRLPVDPDFHASPDREVKLGCGGPPC